MTGKPINNLGKSVMTLFSLDEKDERFRVIIPELSLICVNQKTSLEIGKIYKADMCYCMGKYFYTVFFENGNSCEYNVKDLPGLYNEGWFLIPLSEYRDLRINEILDEK